MASCTAYDRAGGTNTSGAMPENQVLPPQA
jgi:hypothetical protein